MVQKTNSAKYSIVSCGTLRAELESLCKEGFLESGSVFYTAPGLHERPRELKKQLKKQIDNARKHSQKVVVLYGSRCYIDVDGPSRDIDALIREAGGGITRVNAKNCVDMLTAAGERQEISGGEKVYWLTPGWLIFWKTIFRDWDQGKANETFPAHDRAVLVDAVGIFDKYSADSPDKILEFSDWMNLNIEPRKISLDRLKGLIKEGIEK